MLLQRAFSLKSRSSLFSSHGGVHTSQYTLIHRRMCAAKTSFTHIDSANRPTMVDVASKAVSYRQATAQTKVRLPREIISRFKDGDISSPKGPVFATAIIAGTMAVKNTSHLIPFCHPLLIEKCQLQINLDEQAADTIRIECLVAVHHKTGVEMEALTGASVAALCVYDMCKAISHDIVIAETKLIQKSGGKSDVKPPSPAVL